jgi:iron complex outermembrane receptor protein
MRVVSSVSIVAIVVLGLLVGAGQAGADPERARDQARQHFQAGQAAYAAGDLRLAIREFVQADTLVPSPILSFNVGLCHEKLGEDEYALSAYRQYLVRRPDAPHRAEVEAKIAALAERVAAAKAAVVPASPELYEVLEDPANAAPASAPAPASQGTRTLGPGSQGAWVDPHRAPPASPALSPEGAPQATPEALDTPPEPSPVPVASAPPAQKPAPSLPPDGGGQAPSRTPIYKEWKFWLGVAVVTVILVQIGSTRDRKSSNQTFNSGAVLWQF